MIRSIDWSRARRRRASRTASPGGHPERPAPKLHETASTTSPLTATELVDEYFIENRTKLLDIAAFLDRLDRADPACAAERFPDAGLRARRSPRSPVAPDRIGTVQMLFSDPTTEPLDALDRKSAPIGGRATDWRTRRRWRS